MKSMPTIIEKNNLEKQDISIQAGDTLNYCLIIENDGEYTCRFHIAAWATFTGSVIVVAKAANITIETLIEGDNAKSSLQILALAGNESDISVQGISKVEKPYRKVSTRVDQTNILLGTNTHVRGIPILRVATDDVEWGHSCKVHRLGGEALFYLQSRGLEHKDAEALLLSGEIRRHLNVIEEEQKKESLYEEILESLR